MKKKRRVFNKIELLETSVVGIPAYPYAHLSIDTNFMDACIKSFNIQLNPKMEVKMEEQNQVKVEVTEVKEAEVEVKPAEEEVKPEAKPEGETEVEVKSIDIKSAIETAVKEALDKLTVERGLVAEEKSLKEMSLGELAMKSGLFQVK